MPHRIPFSRQTDFTDYVQKHSEARRADSSPFQGDKRRWAPSGAAAIAAGGGTAVAEVFGLSLNVVKTKKPGRHLTIGLPKTAATYSPNW